jgi:hypothetical protein
VSGGTWVTHYAPAHSLDTVCGRYVFSVLASSSWEMVTCKHCRKLLEGKTKEDEE